MTLVEPLSGLRKRIVISSAAVAVGAVILWLLYTRVINVLIRFYRDVKDDEQAKLIFTSPVEGFTVRLNVAAYGGLILALPVVLWQVWAFITPGLYPKERRYALPFVFASMVLFVAGGAVALYTFPQALRFLFGVGGTGLEPLITADKYLKLVVLMIVAFGAAFEFPVLLVFLQLANMVSSRKLVQWWRYAVVVVFVIAAVITPSQDPISLLAMAGPMIVFYFGAAGIGRLLKR
jgi:sec-independent protein translocase protein TatC